MIPWWTLLIAIPLALTLGGGAGFLITNWLFKKKMKANPPINERMIRAMYSQMGRKPTEKQLRSIMNAVKKEQN